MSSLPKRLAFTALSTTLMLGAMELGARLLLSDDLLAAQGLAPQSEGEGAKTMKGNPYLLWEQLPGERQERGASAHINSLGLRGPEPQIPKPEGVRRLLSTGDSSVYGFGVNDGQPFVEVAGRQLSALAPDTIEGWNAAIPGYSSYQSINMLEMRALAMEPDVLVIANLWSDNNFDDFVDKELLSAYSSFETTPTARLHRAMQGFALYRAMNYRLNVATGAQAQARSVGWQVGGQGHSGKRRVAVNDYANNLERLVQIAQSHGAQVVFVLLANQEDLRKRDGPAAWTTYRQVMRDTAARHGAPLVDVPALFAASGESIPSLFLDEMHPTVLGHQLIGGALAQTLTPWAQGEPLMEGGSGGAIPEYEDPFIKAPAKQPGQSAQGTHMELRYSSMKGARLQVDIIDLQAPGQPRVGGAMAQGPGELALDGALVGRQLGVVVFDDLSGDGPSGDDTRFDLRGQAVQLAAGQSLRVDLDSQRVEVLGP